MADLRLGASTWGFFSDSDPGAWISQSEAVRAIVRLGLGVEVWPTRGLDDPPPARDELDRIRDACSEAPFGSVHMRGAYWRWDPSLLREEIELAAFLRAATLVVHPVCLVDGSGRLDVDAVRQAADDAAQLGVCLAVENVPDSARTLDRVLDEVGSDVDATNLGICIDVGHAFLSTDLGTDSIRAYLERYRDQLIHLHLHDNRGTGDDHWPVGEGGIDWPSLIRLLESLGFAGTAVLEVQSTMGGDAPGAIARSVKRISSLRKHR